MDNRAKALWGGYRQVRAAWGLLLDILDLCGIRTVATALIVGIGTAIYARVSRLAAVEWFVLALVAFVAICLASFLLQKRAALKSQHEPILDYEGLYCPGRRAFAVPLNACALQVLKIKNQQVAVRNVARNVKATVDYVHAGGEKLHVENALWENINPRHSSSPGTSIIPSLSLAGDESQGVIISVQQDKSGKTLVLTGDGSTYEELPEGHWSAALKITADTGRPLTLSGGFTVLPDIGGGMRLVFDTPAFQVERPWSLRNWRGSIVAS